MDKLLNCVALHYIVSYRGELFIGIGDKSGYSTLWYIRILSGL